MRRYEEMDQPFLVRNSGEIVQKNQWTTSGGGAKMMIFVQIKLIRRNRKRENEVGVFCETLYKFNKNNGMIIAEFKANRRILDGRRL